MSKEIFYDSTSVIESWIKEDGRIKLQASNSSIMKNNKYNYVKKYNGQLLEFELLVKPDKIHLSTKDFYIISEAFYPTIERYCQEMNSKLCYVYVDENTKDIIFCSELYYVENSISKDTLEILENALIFLFIEHEENLTHISKGRFLSLQPIDNCVVSNHFQNRDTEIWKNNLREILIDSDKDFYELSEDQDEEIVLSISRMVSKGENEYRFYYDLMNNGLLKINYVAIGLDNKIGEPYKYLFSEYINHSNSQSNKAAIMGLNYCGEGIFSSCMTSVLDGSISKMTIDYLEFNCIATMQLEYSNFDILDFKGVDSKRLNLSSEDVALNIDEMFENEDGDENFMDLSLLDDMMLDEIINEISRMNEEDDYY